MQALKFQARREEGGYARLGGLQLRVLDARRHRAGAQRQLLRIQQALLLFQAARKISLVAAPEYPLGCDTELESVLSAYSESPSSVRGRRLLGERPPRGAGCRRVAEGLQKARSRSERSLRAGLLTVLLSGLGCPSQPVGPIGAVR